MDKIREIIKAIAGAAAAGAGALATANADGTVLPIEWALVAASTLAGLGAVYAAPKNKVPVSDQT